MTDPVTDPMTGQPGFQPDQTFSTVWHAQLFALTVHLYDQGVFTWPEWSAALGHHLKAGQTSAPQPPAQQGAQEGPQEGADDRYYLAWMAALMDCLAGKQLTDADEVRSVYDKWAAAYLSTPHGQPVRLG